MAPLVGVEVEPRHHLDQPAQRVDAVVGVVEHRAWLRDPALLEQLHDGGGGDDLRHGSGSPRRDGPVALARRPVAARSF